MRKFTSFFYIPLFIGLAMLIAGSCGKGGGSTPPPNPCAGVTVSVSATTTNPSSPGASDGSISASATGGSGFTFSLNSGAFQASGSFTGLAAGTYNVTAKNSSGCTGSSTFTLTAANPCAGITITVGGTSTNPTTGGGTNGSIAATASGGTGPHTFSRDGINFQASGTFNNLAAGSYTITARDVNNCTGSSNFTLIDPCTGVTITVTGTITHPSAPGASNGSIAASAAGGTGPYSFRIGAGSFQPSGTFNNLAAGSYTITARDANNCTGSANFTLIDPNPCAGVTINANPTTVGNTPCTSPPTGSITSNPSGGTAPYMFSLNGGAFQSTGVFNNLANGNHTLVVRDVNTCSTSVNVNVPNLPQGPLFTLVKTLIQNNCVVCHNSANPNGGMNWEVDCNIVMFKNNIFQRAVNGNPSPMPPSGLLPPSERQKIIDWINAGGRYTD